MPNLHQSIKEKEYNNIWWEIQQMNPIGEERERRKGMIKKGNNSEKKL